MSINRDLMQLKLQKKIILEKLTVTESKMNRLDEILHKKTLLNPKDLRPDEQALTRFGKTVAELRTLNNIQHNKSLPTLKTTYNPYEIEPSTISNPNILKIRTQHVIKTEGVSIVKQKLKEKEDKIKRLELKSKGPTYPKVNVPESMLPNRYIRGELPCTIEHGTGGKYLSWACPLENLDYEYYLPLFFDGLQCKDLIITFIACQGIEDMLYASKGSPERVKSCVKSLVRPLRNALAKFDPEILLWTLKAIQQLITCNEGVGEVLMPYCKQFLAPISMFLDHNKNLGDEIDYGQRKRNDVGEEILRVLELMEEFGGPSALKHIRFSIPLYESCLQRKDLHAIKRAAALEPKDPKY